MSQTERKGTPTPPAALAGLVGTEVGVSRWILVDQARIDAFAEITEDRQFIHIDPDAVPPLEGVVMGVNYGFDKVRFLAPVPAGSRVRGRFTLASAEDKGGGRWLLKHEVTVEIEGSDKPALVAEWLGMQVVGGQACKFLFLRPRRL